MSGTDVIEPRDIAELYSNHNGWLKGWLRTRLNCSETAADLAQDTFVRLLRKDKGNLVIREPRAYLTRVAQRLVINHWRRQDIEQAYLEALALQPEPLVPSVEEQQIIIETIMEVDAMLRSLPDKVHQAFLLSRMDGLTYSAIAQQLGVTERSIKNYMAQAMLHCLQFVEAS